MEEQEDEEETHEDEEETHEDEEETLEDSFGEFIEDSIDNTDILNPQDFILKSGEIQTTPQIPGQQQVETLEGSLAGLSSEEPAEENQNQIYEAVEGRLYQEREEPGERAIETQINPEADFITMPAADLNPVRRQEEMRQMQHLQTRNPEEDLQTYKVERRPDQRMPWEQGGRKKTEKYRARI